MESAVSFALLRPAGFANFTGRGEARTAFLWGGEGWGGASIPDRNVPMSSVSVIWQYLQNHMSNVMICQCKVSNFMAYECHGVSMFQCHQYQLVIWLTGPSESYVKCHDMSMLNVKFYGIWMSWCIDVKCQISYQCQMSCNDISMSNVMSCHINVKYQMSLIVMACQMLMSNAKFQTYKV